MNLLEGGSIYLIGSSKIPGGDANIKDRKEDVMHEQELQNVLETIQGIRGELSRLSEQLRTCMARIEELRPSMPSIYQEERTRWIRQYEETREASLQRFIRENRNAIQSTRELCRRGEVDPEGLALYCTTALMYIAGMSLQGMCGTCNGQLQLLVEHDELYLTCPRCGRWLVQGLKHVP